MPSRLTLPVFVSSLHTYMHACVPIRWQPLKGPQDLALLTLQPDVKAAFGYLLDALNLARLKVEGRVRGV